MSRSYPSTTLLLICSLLLAISCLVSAQDCSATKLCATGCCSEFGFCGTSTSHCGTGCLSTCNFKLDCDANNPCGKGKGCCSKFGFCGLGPDYCAPEVCVAGCDQKSQCNPGYGKSGFAEIEKCPLNVCCSKWGFCGLTKEFCGNRAVSRPSCGDGSTGKIDRVIGYYEGWANERSCQVYLPERIPTGIYTHINFAFAGINPTTFEVVPASNSDIAMYARVVGLKQNDPDLKVNIAIGGWAFNDPGATATTFSDLVGSTANKQKFFASLTSFMATYGFDGVDLDWEYPGADDRSGRPTDFVNFPKFVAELRNVLRSTGGRGELSIAIPASYWYLQHFDIKTLAKHVDYFNLMTYDLHGIWDKGPKLWQGAFLNAHTNLTEIKDSLDLLWRNGISASQVSMGLGFYSRTFTMADRNCAKPGCKFLSEGNAGPCSKAIGVLTNAEIEVIIKEKNLKPVLDKEAAVKIITWDDQWVAYDDADTFKIKSEYARSLCLGGVMVWAISHDSPLSSSSFGLGTAAQRRFISMYSTGVSDGGSPTKEITFQKTQCKWTNCGEVCGNGWNAMVRQDTYRNKQGELMMDATNCDGQGIRTLCCPADMVQPDCHWVFHNNGNCHGDCSVLSSSKKANYVEVGSTSIGCHTGKNQAACCRADNVESISLYDQCDWLGTPGYCDQNTCSASSPLLVASSAGSGGVPCKRVNPGGPSPGDDGYIELRFRPLCCAQSLGKQFKNCEWSKSIGPKPTNKNDNYCRSGCPGGKVRVAMDRSPAPDGTRCEKVGGARVYCCDPDFEGKRTIRNPELDGFEEDLNKFISADGTCSASPLLGKRSTEDELMSNDFANLSLQIRAVSSDNGHGTVVKYLRIMMENIQNGGELGSFLLAVIGIWETGVRQKYPGLTFVKLKKYYDEDPGASATLKLRGYDEEAKEAACKLSYINDRIEGKKLPVACGGSVCEWLPELCNDVDEDIPALNDRNGNTVRLSRRHLHTHTHKRHAVERRSAPGSAHFDFNLQKRDHIRYAQVSKWPVTAGNWPRNFKLTQPDYPTAGSWVDIYPEIYDDALNYVDNEDCSNPLVESHAFPDLPDKDEYFYASEHLVEGQSIPLFITDITAHTNINHGPIRDIARVDLSDFFLNFYDKSIINGAALLPGGLDSDIPSQRVYEAVGSEANYYKFVLLRDEINGIKGSLFGRKQPVNNEKMVALVSDFANPFKPIKLIKCIIAVFNYMNHDFVHPKFMEISNLVRTQWVLAEQAYNALPTTGTSIQLSALWDQWIRSETVNVAITARTFCESWLETLATAWENDNSDLGIQVKLHIVALQSHLGSIFININGLT